LGIVKLPCEGGRDAIVEFRFLIFEFRVQDKSYHKPG
jgi:hypothetical protein